jgi:hypothetical protein
VTFARTLALLLVAALGPALSMVTSCGTPAATTGYTPITGIQIPASVVVAGHGCGPGAQQVYKYAALVAYATADGAAEVPLTTGVFDCFADAIFSNLPSTDGGNPMFDVSIYAYTRHSFLQAFGCPQDSAPCTVDAGSTGLWQAAASWTTMCTSTEQNGITVIASCHALEPVDEGSASSDAAPSE